MVDGKCIIHLKPLELVQEENYFFELSKYTDKITGLIEKNKLIIIPEGKRNETLAMLKQGMEDVSFSRTKDKYWGLQVPGDSSQVMYVWCDALSNYISAIGYTDETKQFKKYWPADVHCIGKDIMKFHTIFWPAMLLSAGLELPKTIFVHGFINVAGQKMSKSLGNVIDPFLLVNKYGVDAVRYYLLREILPTEDGDFTYEKFEQRYNSDLADGIGNLLARTIALAKKPGFIISNKPAAPWIKDGGVKRIKENYKKQIEEFKFNEALKSIWEIIDLMNGYINEKKPWELGIDMSQVVSDSIFILEEISDLIYPFLPETSEKIKRVLKSRNSEILFPKLLIKK